MPELRLANEYVPLPQQQAFRRSPARIRAYGGAMGGGKSRALCEEAFDLALEHPGALIPIFRQSHTSITLTTRKTFYDQVLPVKLRARTDLVKVKKSQGEDYCQFWNGSQIHFVGLDDPIKWFSSELAVAMFDEAHEIREQDVLTINSRLRQRCPVCVRGGLNDCAHMPHGLVLCFNPAQPGHWLQQWFILGGSRTEWGWRKQELIVPGADFSIGDSEFVLAKATDNTYLPPGYIDKALSGMKTAHRQRYLDGDWVFIGGDGFFDQDALSQQAADAMETMPLLIGEPGGDLTGSNPDDRPHLGQRKMGRLEVYAAPVRDHVTDAGVEVRAHRYIVGVDASTGAAADFSAVQVVDSHGFEQVAEWQGKVDPDKLAETAFLLACVYNGALLVPETTGGWGFSVTKTLQRLIAGWHGPPPAKPRLYTRKIIDRISQRWTDKLGFDTNVRTRSLALSTLEETLREGSVSVHGNRTLAELAAFAIPERSRDEGSYASPRARAGHHDDLVMALAIAVYIATTLPKGNRSLPPRQSTAPAFGAAGY